mmetsp:Transcript_36205/g.61392  ORF Transcript_36205/g.61392 Transcript_36205/m.61392 type:complete len:254 (-) Transcript_36205:923-1684(-)
MRNRAHKQHARLRGPPGHRVTVHAQVRLAVAAQGREAHQVKVVLQAPQLQQVHKGRAHVAPQAVFFEPVALRERKVARVGGSLGHHQVDLPDSHAHQPACFFANQLFGGRNHGLLLGRAGEQLSAVGTKGNVQVVQTGAFVHFQAFHFLLKRAHDFGQRCRVKQARPHKPPVLVHVHGRGQYRDVPFAQGGALLRLLSHVGVLESKAPLGDVALAGGALRHRHVQHVVRPVHPAHVGLHRFGPHGGVLIGKQA